MTRRFPPPRSIEDTGAAFVVKDASGQKLGYFYYEEESGRRSAAKMLTKDEAAPDRGQRGEAAGALEQGLIGVSSRQRRSRCSVRILDTDRLCDIREGAV